MKTQNLYRFMIAVMLISAGNLTAQEIKGGTVKYQKTTKHDFESMFSGRGGNSSARIANYQMRGRMSDFMASLPKESKSGHVLYFTESEALYEEDATEIVDQDPRMQGMLTRISMMGPPEKKLVKLYHNLKKNETIEQIVFMTRDFRVSTKLEPIAWKLAAKNTKILDYMCMAAETQIDGKTITAYFTSEIPFSLGPDKYTGLPGLVLAIEIDGQTAFVATSVDLTVPAKGLLSKPGTGKKITQKKFDKLIAEKMKEYRESRGRGRDRSMGVRH